MAPSTWPPAPACSTSAAASTAAAPARRRSPAATACRRATLSTRPARRWRDGQHGEPELLASCYRNCLRLASENGCHTVDFPSISTGIYHFPLDQAAQIAVREITAYLADHPEITRVRMVCFDSRTRAAYAAALAAQECAG